MSLTLFGMFILSLPCSGSALRSPIQWIRGMQAHPLLQNRRAVHHSLLQSNGFFLESDTTWMIRKRLHDRQLRKEYDNENANSGNGDDVWWQNHYDPTFHCRFERRLGKFGDGGKWVCNPHRIAEMARHSKSCIVYSVGSDGDFSFERSIMDEISEQCEIHTFDKNDNSFYVERASKDPSFPLRDEPVPQFVHHHVAEIGSSHPAVSIPEMIDRLGHRNKTIDIFKIDCEGCEWQTYTSWLDNGVNIRQILVELHRPFTSEMGHKFFRYFINHGYAVFHKEPNGSGCIEIAMIKLSKEFTSILDDTPS